MTAPTIRGLRASRAAIVWRVEPPSFESGEALRSGNDSPAAAGAPRLDGVASGFCSVTGWGPASAAFAKIARDTTASNARFVQLSLPPSMVTNAFLAITARLRRALGNCYATALTGGNAGFT